MHSDEICAMSLLLGIQTARPLLVSSGRTKDAPPCFLLQDLGDVVMLKVVHGPGRCF